MTETNISSGSSDRDDGAAATRPFHERFWWLPIATVAVGCLALTGVAVWFAYFGALARV